MSASKCAIFVCNKWNLIREKEYNEVKSHIVNKLKRCWPGLDPETQIIYIKTKNATKSTKAEHHYQRVFAFDGNSSNDGFEKRSGSTGNSLEVARSSVVCLKA